MAKHLKKGSGEIVMYSVALLPIMTMLILMTALLQLSRAYSELNKAATTTGRAVAICTSREDADQQATRVATSCITTPYLTDIQTDIQIVDTGNFGEGFDWGMGQVVKVTVSGYVSTISAPINKRYQRSTLVKIEGGGAYLGLWRLTAYCNCSACCGIWAGGATASGRWPTPNRTIAIASSTMRNYGFQFGDRFLIRGHIYTLEDHGDSNMAASNGGKCIDIYVASHGETYNDAYNGYADVFYLGHGG